MTWHLDNNPNRPDRYIDWNRFASLGSATGSSSGPDGQPKWAMVAIKVTVALDEDMTEKQIWEQWQLALDGLNSKVVNPASSFTPKMSKSELLRLLSNVRSINNYLDPENQTSEPRHEAGNLIFRGSMDCYYIYLPESQIYDGDGGYRTHDQILIRFSGPPISNFNPNFQTNETARGSLETGLVRPVGIGIIDDGIAFVNERFGDRVERVWLQDIAEFKDGEVTHGKLLKNSDFSSQRRPNMHDMDFYADANIGQADFGKDRHPSIAFRLAHGTHVLDIAAGLPPDQNVGGNPIFAVQLPPQVTADTSGQSLATHVIKAIVEIFDWADCSRDAPIPLVINFSYGYTAGPKDGSSLLEKEIDKLVSQRNENVAPTVVVLPAGNNFESRTTAKIELRDANSKTIDWVILPDDETENFLEIWVDQMSESLRDPKAYQPLEIEVTPPDGTSSERLALEVNKVAYLEKDGRAVAGVYFDSIEHPEGSGRYRYRYFLAVNRTKDLDDNVETAQAGAWQIVLAKATDDGIDCIAHMYIQRDDTPAGYRKIGRQSYFDHKEAYGRDDKTGDYWKPIGDCPITGDGSMSAIGNGACTVVVGGVESSGGLPAARYSSSGETITKNGPFVSAVSDESRIHSGIYAAGTQSGSYVAMNGTSVAAPQVTRWIADQMSQGVISQGMNCEDIRHVLEKSLATDVKSGNALGWGDTDKRRGKATRKPKQHLPVERVYPQGDWGDP